VKRLNRLFYGKLRIGQAWLEIFLHYKEVKPRHQNLWANFG
jgi:hypothetical protein